MLIGVISDTHDNLPQIKKAVSLFNGKKVSLVLHAGDIISPFCVREFKELTCEMIAVFGNNDGEKKVWYDVMKDWGQVHWNYYENDIEGKRVLLMHEPYHLEELALSQKFDVIVYGHTHKIDKRISGRTLIVNPGECGGWLSNKSTVGILKLPEKEFETFEL